MNPVAFTIFGLEVRWYGIFIALGVFLGFVFALRLVKKSDQVNEDMLTDFGTLAIIFGVLGARLYYVIFSWDYYGQHLNEVLSIRNGGLAIHGGILAGILVGLVYTRIKKVSFFEMADLVAPSLALGQSIGRWGNYANQEAHGGPTNLPWAIEVQGVMVHPTFLYESLWTLGIFLFLYFYLAKRRKFRGQLFSLYLVLYSLARFFIEGLRTDSLYWGPLRVAQLVSLLGIGVGLALYFILKNRKEGKDLTLK
ncbi:MAG: prolipoprotein diacylglyceryl transferase [Tissierellia bacterium]|nr:prolipoprotein diacylglyceryl transferase [Tissierellia bacterium]